MAPLCTTNHAESTPANTKHASNAAISLPHTRTSPSTTTATCSILLATTETHTLVPAPELETLPPHTETFDARTHFQQALTTIPLEETYDTNINNINNLHDHYNSKHLKRTLHNYRHRITQYLNMRLHY